MDKLKGQVADVVRNAVQKAVQDAFEDVSVFKLTDLQVQIRFPGNHGPRYFIVQIREAY